MRGVAIERDPWRIFKVNAFVGGRSRIESEDLRVREQMRGEFISS